MTALEEQLTRALRKLSAQYETEQQRHSEQVEALQMRIERLDALATRLAEYSGTSAVARPRGLRI